MAINVKIRDETSKIDIYMNILQEKRYWHIIKVE